MQVQSLAAAVQRQHATTFHIQPASAASAASKHKTSSSAASAASKQKTSSSARERDKTSAHVVSLQQQPLFQSPFS